jgi:Protein of unknown function DUF262
MITEELLVPKLITKPLSVEELEPEEVRGNILATEIGSQEKKLITHPYDLIIRQIKEQVDEGQLILADDFQRRRVWNDFESSLLIESLLISVPIPMCYFAEVGNVYSVIDGQQRLTAIYRFLSNEFSLNSLSVRPDLNGRKFCSLGVAETRTLLNRSIRCIVILKESDPAIRLDVFARLNSSSVQLNEQELRNGLYGRGLNKLLLELSTNSVFQQIRGVDDVDKRMQDCEMILRFFAFHFQPEKYQGAMSPFLTEYLSKRQKPDSYNANEHREIFLKVINDIAYVFGENSFRRYNPESNTWGQTISRGVYDIVMLYFAQMNSVIIRAKKEDVILSFKQLFSDTEFKELIYSSSTNRIQARLDKWYHLLCLHGIQVERVLIG